MTIQTSMLYQVVYNSKSYFHCVHHRLVPGKCFERHCHRSKLKSWYWQKKYIPDTGKDSGVWMSFVPGTHFYRQKTKYTKPAPNPVPTTNPETFQEAGWRRCMVTWLPHKRVWSYAYDVSAFTCHVPPWSDFLLIWLVNHQHSEIIVD